MDELLYNILHIHAISLPNVSPLYNYLLLSYLLPENSMLKVWADKNSRGNSNHAISNTNGKIHIFDNLSCQFQYPFARILTHFSL